MSSVVTYGRILGGVLLLLGNGFFVGIEFAMTRVRQFSESEFQGHRGLERAWEMTERLEIFLSGCQVGITICSVGLGVVAEPALTTLIAEGAHALGYGAPGGGHTTLSVVLSLALINIMHVIVGEQTPTYFGVERTKTAAKYGAPLLYWWTKIMSPVIYFADKTAKLILKAFGVEMSRSWTEAEVEEGEEGGVLPSTRSELRRQMGESMSEMGLSRERTEEVINALEIGQIPVRDVMLPSEDIVALSTAVDPEENFRRMEENPHTRYPLVGTEMTDFEGIVYSPVLVRYRDRLATGNVDFSEVAAPPMTMSPDTDVADAIDQFQTENQELALIIEEGNVVGMVTVTDLLESVMGDIEDPIDTDYLEDIDAE